MVLQPIRGFVVDQFEMQDLNMDGKNLVLKYLLFESIVRSIIILSNTFMILYVIDNQGYTAAGTLVAISFVVQAITDYPTGILSDWIGQKIVLIISFLSFGVSFYLLSTAVSYNNFVLAYVFYAFALAQQSGTSKTWFDNNYRHISKNVDPEREIYKGIIAKFRTIVDLFGAIMLIVGGLLATYVSRSFVFRIQTFGMIILIVITYVFINDFESLEKTEVEVKRYFSLLKEGITSVLTSKLLFILVLASVLYSGALGIFGNLILFPIYFGYTGNDFYASIFRFTLFITGSIALWLIADKVRKMNEIRWQPRFHLTHTIVFYLGMFILFLIFPIRNNFNLTAIVLFGSLIFVSHMLRVVLSIFIESIYLDLIPDERRNGFYSLIPTIVLLIQTPIAIYSGEIIETEGHTTIFLVLGSITLISSILFFIAMRALDDHQNERNQLGLSQAIE